MNKLILNLKLLLIFLVFTTGCSSKNNDQKKEHLKQYITILGIAQDGGYPHIGCQKQCCKDYYSGKNKRKNVVSLGLVDLENQQKWLFDATPDMHIQLASLENNHLKNKAIIDSVFLTHAHIGHYTGLMYFGREAYGKQNIPVFAMPKMATFLEENGPWSQLVDLNNISLIKLKQDSIIKLNNKLMVTPFKVPHRDEFSETVGYKIQGAKKSALFIPDIDKWHKWKRNIVEEVKQVDYAFLDASFYKDGELKRPMSEIPHPFIIETIQLFENKALSVKNKIIFIHFNHTNPALQENSKERKVLKKQGFNFATEGDNYEL